MSALECPCQSKGEGVLHDSSCWLHGFIGCRVEQCLLKKLRIILQTDFVDDYFECYSLRFFSCQQGYDFTPWHAHAGWLVPRSQWARLFHAVPQHLIGCDEHDADDECHGKGADEALPHARLTILLWGVNWKTNGKMKSRKIKNINKKTRWFTSASDRSLNVSFSSPTDRM